MKTCRTTNIILQRKTYFSNGINDFGGHKKRLFQLCFFPFWFIRCIFSVRLAIFGRTRQSVILSAIKVLKLKRTGRAEILRAQPIADKEKSPWNRSLTRLGSRPSAASVETSITPVLNTGGRHWLQDRGNKGHWVGEFYNLGAGGETEGEETVSRRSLSRPTFLLNVNVGRPGKGNRSFFFLTYFLTNSRLMDSLERLFCYSHRKPRITWIMLFLTWHNRAMEHNFLFSCHCYIKCLALLPVKYQILLLCESCWMCCLAWGSNAHTLTYSPQNTPARVLSVDLASLTNRNKDANQSWQTQTV